MDEDVYTYVHILSQYYRWARPSDLSVKIIYYVFYILNVYTYII